MRHRLPVLEGLIYRESRISITDRQKNLFDFPLWRREGNRGSSDGRQFRSNFCDKPIFRGEEVHVPRQCIRAHREKPRHKEKGGRGNFFAPRFTRHCRIILLNRHQDVHLAYSLCQTRSQTFMHCKQNEETQMFTDMVPNIPQMKQNCLGFNFDVHLPRQHREKPSRIGFQVILSTGKRLILCR